MNVVRRWFWKPGERAEQLCGHGLRRDGGGRCVVSRMDSHDGMLGMSEGTSPNFQDRLNSLMEEADLFTHGSQERTNSLEQIRSMLADKGTTMRRRLGAEHEHPLSFGSTGRLHHQGGGSAGNSGFMQGGSLDDGHMLDDNDLYHDGVGQMMSSIPEKDSWNSPHYGVRPPPPCRARAPLLQPTVAFLQLTTPGWLNARPGPYSMRRRNGGDPAVDAQLFVRGRGTTNTTATLRAPSRWMTWAMPCPTQQAPTRTRCRRPLFCTEPFPVVHRHAPTTPRARYVPLTRDGARAGAGVPTRARARASDQQHALAQAGSCGRRVDCAPPRPDHRRTNSGVTRPPRPLVGCISVWADVCVRAWGAAASPSGSMRHRREGLTRRSPGESGDARCAVA